MQKTLAILSGLAAASIWGGMYVVSEVVLETIPPFTLLSLRLLLGILVLGTILLVRNPGAVRREAWLPLLGVGAIGYGLSLGLQFVGTKLSTASNASLVTSASPAFMIVFAAILLGERITPRRLGALVLASAGVLAVIDPRTAQMDEATLWGNMALFGAAVTWGLYSVLIRRVSFQRGTLGISLVTFVGGFLVGLPAVGIELRDPTLGQITFGIVLGVLYLGVVSTAGAMYLWNKSLALLEAGEVSLLFFAQPVVGAALGALLLGEQLGPGFWLGGVLIAAGLLIASGISLTRQSPRVANTP